MVDEKRAPPEISVETLQGLSFEIIAKLVKLWRNLEITNSPGKGRKFSYGSMLHRMIIDALRFHPDIVELGKLHDMEREVAADYEAYLAGKAGINQEQVGGTEQKPTPTATDSNKSS